MDEDDGSDNAAAVVASAGGHQDLGPGRSMQSESDRMDDLDLARAHLPVAFGRATGVSGVGNIGAASASGPRDKGAGKGTSQEPDNLDEEEEDGGSDEEAVDPRVGGVVETGDDDPYGLPITHEAILKGHTKAVSCLDVEHSGTRMAPLLASIQFWTRGNG
ncbi:hypothetical protein VaNZ11_006687 [Volvox africanus]|uniref:Uncharacterized protein n=1 Tax=Volvox africanus TaxID=51714 RepID=A0ABQ5S2M0_9CHLO|nr:hypothetical protein VaNZ11_006687 [Volvox africanus]